jgi:hypothetical protein
MARMARKICRPFMIRRPGMTTPGSAADRPAIGCVVARIKN